MTFFAIGVLFGRALKRDAVFLKTSIEDVKLKILAIYSAYTGDDPGLTPQTFIRALGEYGVDDRFFPGLSRTSCVSRQFELAFGPSGSDTTH